MEADSDLLGRFIDDGDQGAFTALVQRKVGLIYSAALRQTGGDAHLARDVTQAVFLALAARAASLRRHEVLTAWLFTTTRFLSHKALRTQRRWQQREQDANAMTMLSRESDAAWEQLRPCIDETLHELGERDRQAIVLRFFDGRTFAEIGAAMGAAENAARMRVDRALEKLRARLARRGITSTATALGAALAHQPVVAVPAGLAAAISVAPLAGVALGGSGMAPAWAALDFMAKLKLTSVAVMAVAAVASGSYLIAQQSRETAAPGLVAGSTELASLRAENLQLKAEVARLNANASATPAAAFPELQVLTAAVKDRVIQPVGTLLRTTQGQLAPAVAALFKLTAEDKVAFEETLESARHRVDTLSAANVASVERSSPTQMKVRIGAFAAEGGKVHDEFLAGLRKTLGAERATALMTLMGSNFDRHVGSGFGSSERTLIIDRRAVGPVDRYFVTEQVQSAPGSLQSHTNMYNLDRDGLERDYPSLVKLLPAEFLD